MKNLLKCRFCPLLSDHACIFLRCWLCLGPDVELNKQFFLAITSGVVRYFPEASCIDVTYHFLLLPHTIACDSWEHPASKAFSIYQLTLKTAVRGPQHRATPVATNSVCKSSAHLSPKDLERSTQQSRVCSSSQHGQNWATQLLRGASQDLMDTGAHCRAAVCQNT